MLNKKQAILIGEADFLENFYQTFLSDIEITPWKREFGSKDRLNKIREDSLDMLFIQGELSYSKDNLVFWIRSLRNGGMLFLEALPSEYNPLFIAEMLSSLVKYIKAPNNDNIWIFQKNVSQTIPELYAEMMMVLRNSKDENHIWNAIENFELRSPSEVASTYIKTKLLLDKNYKYPILDYWHIFISKNPSISMVIFLSFIYMIMGDYSKGFKIREMILSDVHGRRTKIIPTDEQLAKRWKGESLNEKTIVIWTEFGLGDELMFAQLAYYLKNRGAKKVIILAQEPIVSILETHPDIDQVIALKDIKTKLNEFDYWVYPHEILAYINIPFKNVPKRFPYLFSNNKKANEFSKLFNKNKKLKVGIVWKGDPSHENDHFRSIHELAYIEALFLDDKVDWYCLQKECNESELALLKKYDIPHIAQSFNDFSDTAAALENIDLLVSVDTSIVHLAGAMNIPTYLIQPYISDWRWDMLGQDNPWYPSVKSFRNIAPDYNWTNVIYDIKQAINDYDKKYHHD